MSAWDAFDEDTVGNRLRFPPEYSTPVRDYGEEPVTDEEFDRRWAARKAAKETDWLAVCAAIARPVRLDLYRCARCSAETEVPERCPVCGHHRD
jgi:rubrerythrin